MAVELLPGKPTEEEIRQATLPSCRPEYSPWVLGRTYEALIAKGYRQAKIAEAVGKSQQHVSRCLAIYQGLCPAAHDVISRLAGGIGIHAVVEVAMIRDRNGAPDREGQLARIEKLLGKDTLAKVKLRPERFSELLQREYPPAAAHYVLPVLRYLSGESDSLDFPPEAPCPSPTQTPAPPRRARSRTRSTG